MKTGIGRPVGMGMALSVITFSLGCGGDVAPVPPGGRPDRETDEAGITSDMQATIGLKVEKVRPQLFTFAVTAPGKVRANQNKVALVSPVIEGKVHDVFVSWGQLVKKGQQLASLESVAVGEAKAAHFRARAELRVAEANLTRKRRLSEEQIIPEKDLLEAEAEYTAMQGAADAAEKALHVIGFTEQEVASFSERHDLTSMMPIVAPISGKIVDRQAVIGALAEPSMVLFTIMDLRTLWVDAELYEKDLDKVRVNQPVDISVIAYPGETFSGHLSYIGDTLDEERRTAVVRTVVNNPGGRLKPGMFATVRIVTTEKKNAIVVPEGTVLREGGRPVVVVADAGRYRLQDVQLGSVADGRIEILSGLNSGDRVVTKGHYQLATQLLSRSDSQ